MTKANEPRQKTEQTRRTQEAMERSAEAVRHGRYLPIREYALIGDCHGAALVSCEGSIDWCCMERFDADPIFCRILDDERGGFFSLMPSESAVHSRYYYDDTNILETVHGTEGGEIVTTDFMPVGRKSSCGVHNYVDLCAPWWIIRKVTCKVGPLRVQLRYKPSKAFAREKVVLHAHHDRIEMDGGDAVLYSDVPVEIDGDLAQGEFEMAPGDEKWFILAAKPIANPPTRERLAEILQITTQFWREWSGYNRYRGPYGDVVMRSALVLKLMTYAPTGAIVAAPTTSLPEALDGNRNWDYRYCWLRDASFVLYALGSLGYTGEARRFAEYLYAACEETCPNLRIMYGIDLNPDLPERNLDHLEGYRGCRPVRVGNAAYRQNQLDVYGEVMDWAHLYHELGERFSDEHRNMLRQVADHVVDHWREADHGIWEMRGKPQHHVFGKIMCWVALDRAIRLFGPNDRYEKECEAIVEAVHEQGTHPDNGHLVAHFETEGTDAVMLQAALVGFPISEHTFEATVAAVQRDLQHGCYVFRYNTSDNLSGREGAFLVCSFWLVDALLVLDRIEEAHEFFQRLLQHSNDVSLYSEEIHPETDEFLGNYPQALTHLALIRTANLLRLYERKGAKALRGTHADRARHNLEPTKGVRTIWSGFKKSHRVRRLLSSRKSMLNLDDLI